MAKELNQEPGETRYGYVSVEVEASCGICGFDETKSLTRDYGYYVFKDGSDNRGNFALPNALNAANAILQNDLFSKHKLTKCKGTPTFSTLGSSHD